MIIKIFSQIFSFRNDRISPPLDDDCIQASPTVAKVFVKRLVADSDAVSFCITVAKPFQIFYEAVDL